MLKVNTVQTNFTSGELSPWLLGRSDIERYQNGAETLENFVARHQGGIVRRRGTRNVARSAQQGENDSVRLLDFVYSRNDSVVIEIYEGGFRFHRNGEPITRTESGTSGADDLIATRTYTIASIGDEATDFTTVGSADNVAGTIFTATGTPAGSGTVYQTGNTISRPDLLVAGQQYKIGPSNNWDWTPYGAAANTTGTIFTATSVAPAYVPGFVFPNNPISATALSAFTQYVILSPGSTDFTALSAANNNVGTVFVATGAGTGSGTVLAYSSLLYSHQISIGNSYWLFTPEYDWTRLGASTNTLMEQFTATDVGYAYQTGYVQEYNTVNATDIVVGTSYVVRTTGGDATDFTDVGAANNDIGTVFTATGPTTGSGTATYNWVFSYDVTTVYGSSTAVPYTSDEINELQFAQSADVLFITHENHPPATLSRYGDNDWRYEIPEIDYGPYMDQEPGDQDISLTLSGVVDRVRLTSTATDFNGSSEGDLVEYSHAGQKVLGLVTLVYDDYSVQVEPLEDRSLVLSKEVYSPGLYTSWDGTNSVPVYDATITGTGVDVAFSATGVITQEHIGNYLRFTDRSGTYYWMLVNGVEDILRQGAYGIIATGDILDVTIPTGVITRSERTINARLASSQSDFFNVLTDSPGRLFRLILGDTVVHARGRPSYTMSGIVNNGDNNLYLANVGDLLPGDTVTGTGIPANTQIVALFPSEEQTYALLSNAATSSHVGEFTINASTTQELSVKLNRPIPRSVEGLTTVQNGTSNDWNRGSWYVGNFPRTVSFHEGRLGFAGTPEQPQTVWLSKTDDLYNFAATTETLKVLDDSAITFTIASDTLNEIAWIVSRSVLVVGTAGEEWRVVSSNQGAPLTPTTVSVQSQSTYGSAFVKPIRLGRAVLYLQAGGRKLRQMTYEFSSDSQVSLDLTVFAEHILKDHGGAQQLAYGQLPESIVYARLDDGQVAFLTYEPDQQVYAWTRLVIGGPSAVVESIACVPESGEFRLYLVVRRTVNGDFVRTIEVLSPEFRPTSSTDFSDLVFMDNYLLGGGGSDELTDLDDYAGCTVNVLVDDTVHHDLTVAADGTLTLPSVPTDRYAIGFGYTSTLKTFPLEAPAQAGTGQGKKKRIDHISLRLLDTINFQHGPSLDRMTEEDTGADELFSGDYRVTFNQGHDTRGAYFIVQEKSYPLAILSLMPETGQYA